MTADGGGSIQRVVVAERDRAVGQALSVTIDQADGLQCAGLVASVADVSCLTGSDPDVVLLDTRLLAADPEETLALARRSPVVLLGAHFDASLLALAAGNGACGVASRDRDLAPLLRTLRGPFDGRFRLEAEELAALSRSAQPPGGAGPRLSQRELEVLGLLEAGLAAGRIAERLSISVHTSRGHVKSVLGKLDAHSALEAVARGRALGLLAA